MTDNERLNLLLENQDYMVLVVTLDDGKPWATPVRVREHDGLRSFDWDSHVQTEHSKALMVRPNVAMTIFEKRDTYQTGLYAKGTAELIEEFKPGFGRYRFTATQAWINDETFRKRAIEL